MDYLIGVLSILDMTIREMMEIPIFATFFGGFVMVAVLGIVLVLKGVSGGK